MQWQTLDKLSFSEMKYKELLIIYRISALFEIIQPKLTLLYLLNILLINSKKNFQKPLNSKHLSYYKELKLRISLYLNHNLTKNILHICKVILVLIKMYYKQITKFE